MQLNHNILYTYEFKNCSQNSLEHFAILVEKPYLHLFLSPHFPYDFCQTSPNSESVERNMTFSLIAGHSRVALQNSIE